MNRRHFLSVLAAVIVARRLPMRDGRLEAVERLGALYDSHKNAIEENAENLRRNTEALLRYAPTGFQKHV